MKGLMKGFANIGRGFASIGEGFASIFGSTERKHNKYRNYDKSFFECMERHSTTTEVEVIEMVAKKDQ